LFVVAEPVEEIEDGIFSRFVGVVAGRKDDAVVHGVGEDFARQGITFDAAGGGGNGIREVKEKEEIQEVKETGRVR
jgi:acetyl/propionyl-CoA carboxylase alpha subunit